MKIAVRGKNIEATPALIEYAEKRLSKLDKHFDTTTEIQVVLSVIKEDHIVEVTVFYNGLILRGEESTIDMYASIDLVIEKLERQIKKYKTRMNRSLRQRGMRVISEKHAASEAEERMEENASKLVKIKRFPLKLMNVEEAILQMDLLGHNFFVFANSDNDLVSVVYSRKDGHYGLIEPE